MDTFTTTKAFCCDCGTSLPLPHDKGDIACYICKRHFDTKALGDMRTKYTVHFNSIEAVILNAKEEMRRKNNSVEGPIVERRCPKCENDVMSYATIQLRSADEGQTVFYTCTKCKYREHENS